MILAVVLLVALFSSGTAFSPSAHLRLLGLDSTSAIDALWLNNHAPLLVQYRQELANASVHVEAFKRASVDVIDQVADAMRPSEAPPFFALHMHSGSLPLQVSTAAKVLAQLQYSSNFTTPFVHFNWNETSLKSHTPPTDWLDKLFRNTYWSLASSKQVRNMIILQLSQWMCIGLSHPSDIVAFSNMVYMLHTIADSYSSSRIRRLPVSTSTESTKVSHEKCRKASIDWILSPEMVDKEAHSKSESNSDDWEFGCAEQQIHQILKMYYTARMQIRQLATQQRSNQKEKARLNFSTFDKTTVDKFEHHIQQSVQNILSFVCSDVLQFASSEVSDYPAGGVPAALTASSLFLKHSSILPTGNAGTAVLMEYLAQGRRLLRKHYTKIPVHLEAFWYPTDDHPDYCELISKKTDGPWMCPAFELDHSRNGDLSLLMAEGYPAWTNIGSRFFRYDDTLRQALQNSAVNARGLLTRLERVVMQVGRKYHRSAEMITAADILNVRPLVLKEMMPFSLSLKHCLIAGGIGSVIGAIAGAIANEVQGYVNKSPLLTRYVKYGFVFGALLGSIYSALVNRKRPVF